MNNTLVRDLETNKMEYELIVIWCTGEKEIYGYSNKSEAETGESNMKMAFGNQVSWTGIREKR